MDELNDRLFIGPFRFTIPIYTLLCSIEADSEPIQQ